MSTDAIRRLRKLAPFVRQIGERKAQACAIADITPVWPGSRTIAVGREFDSLMSFPRTAAFFLLFSSLGCLAQLEPSGCRSYEPAVVALHGTLVRKTFAGPPNYEDIRKGDAAETYWLLNLDSPICVDEDKTDPDLNPAQKNIRRVQLVLDPKAYEQFKALLGKRVVATGSLFGAHTGHHHTPVLLTVTSLEQPHWK
jgi:hypothetical protein